MKREAKQIIELKFNDKYLKRIKKEMESINNITMIMVTSEELNKARILERKNEKEFAKWAKELGL